MIKDIGRKLENAKYRLSEVNTWISNFDSKASFLLAYVGILIGFLGTTGIPSVFYATFENSLQTSNGIPFFSYIAKKKNGSMSPLMILNDCESLSKI